MKIEELRWFLSLCATESTRASAAQLGVDQSALSRALGRLEAELGNQLFHREGRNLRVNHLGRLYQPHVHRAVGELDAGRRTLMLRSGGTQTLRLGFPHGAGIWFAAWSLDRLLSDRPGTEVMLREGTARQLHAWLAEGLLDAIVVGEPRQRVRLEWLPLPAQVLRLALPVRHRFSGRGVVALSDLAGQPMVSYQRGTDIRELIDAALADARVPSSPVLESNDTAALEATVRAGVGAAVLLSAPGRTGFGLVLRETGPAVVWALGLAFSSRSRWASELQALVAAAGKV